MTEMAECMVMIVESTPNASTYLYLMCLSGFLQDVRWIYRVQNERANELLVLMTELVFNSIVLRLNLSSVLPIADQR